MWREPFPVAGAFDDDLVAGVGQAIQGRSRLTQTVQTWWWIALTGPAGYGNEVIPELSRAPLGSPEGPLTILLFVVVRTLVHVVLSISQHGVDDSGQLVRCRSYGLGGSQLCPFPAVKRPQGTVSGAARRRRAAMPPRPDWCCAWFWSLGSCPRKRGCWDSDPATTRSARRWATCSCPFRSR